MGDNVRSALAVVREQRDCHLRRHCAWPHPSPMRITLQVYKPQVHLSPGMKKWRSVPQSDQREILIALKSRNTSEPIISYPRDTKSTSGILGPPLWIQFTRMGEETKEYTSLKARLGNIVYHKSIPFRFTVKIWVSAFKHRWELWMQLTEKSFICWYFINQLKDKSIYITLLEKYHNNQWLWTRL